MNKKTAKLIVQKLSGVFTDKPALNFSTPYELLIAVILSAQCTDERVNKITRELFKEYNTPDEASLHKTNKETSFVTYKKGEGVAILNPVAHTCVFAVNEEIMLKITILFSLCLLLLLSHR